MLSRMRSRDKEEDKKPPPPPEPSVAAKGAKSAAPQEAAPTMIVPRGTEITVDAHGQLSIRAPGNLVLQNSGSYGTLESVAGSIRIERGVEVEAVSVRCADHCYVQGSLTAWTVEAKSLQIEEAGQAYIVLQETERLEVGKEGRLVGNFSSEKELFLLFSRFADQLRGLRFFDRAGPRSELAEVAEGRLPGGAVEKVKGAGKGLGNEDGESPRDPRDLLEDRGDGHAGVGVGDLSPDPEPPAESPAVSKPAAAGGELPESLLFALVLLEREVERKSYGPTSQRALTELIKLLRERDLDTLQLIYRTLFARIVEPRDDTRRARQLVEEWHRALPAA